jgi:hypothetical protein
MDCHETSDDTLAPYSSDADLMATIDMGIHPGAAHSPFRYITILPPDQRVDLYGHSTSFNGFELAMPRRSPPKPLSGILASRIQFAVDVLKDIPRMMVAEMQTPWCHRQLYRHNMPQEMQGGCKQCKSNVYSTYLTAL